MRTIFLIITRRPTDFVVDFADDVARILPGDVFVVSNTGFDRSPAVARAVVISDSDVKAAGFCGSTPLIPDSPTAWDKVLYFLAQKSDFDFAWIAEDDVFFANPQLVVEMLNRCKNSDVDCLTAPPLFRRSTRPDWLYWDLGAKFDPAEQASGFPAITRLSRRLVEHCRDFAAANGSLAFVEVMFPSLALRHGLSIQALDFISTRRFRWGPAFCKSELLQKRGGTLEKGVFHPVKFDDLRKMATGNYFQWSNPKTWDIVLFRIFGPPVEFYRYTRKRAPGIPKRIRRLLHSVTSS